MGTPHQALKFVARVQHRCRKCIVIEHFAEHFGDLASTAGPSIITVNKVRRITFFLRETRILFHPGCTFARPKMIALRALTCDCGVESTFLWWFRESTFRFLASVAGMSPRSRHQTCWY